MKALDAFRKDKNTSSRLKTKGLASAFRDIAEGLENHSIAFRDIQITEVYELSKPTFTQLMVELRQLPYTVGDV